MSPKAGKNPVSVENHKNPSTAHVEETGVFRACAARENPCGTKRQQTSPLPLGKTLGQTGLTLGRIRVSAQCLLARQYHLEAGAQTNASMPYRCPREGGLVKSPSPGPHRIIFDGCTRGIYPQWAGTQPLACVFFQYGLCRAFLYNCDDEMWTTGVGTRDVPEDEQPLLYWRALCSLRKGAKTRRCLRIVPAPIRELRC
jgi:hypothetical protein